LYNEKTKVNAENRASIAEPVSVSAMLSTRNN